MSVRYNRSLPYIALSARPKLHFSLSANWWHTHLSKIFTASVYLPIKALILRSADSWITFIMALVCYPQPNLSSREMSKSGT